MSKISALLLSFLLVIEPALASQQTSLQKLSVGTPTAVTSSSVLDVNSTSKGARPCPSMTGAQRDAISSPATGLCVYVTDASVPSFYTYNGTAWAASGSGGGGGGIYSGGTNLLTNNSWESDASSWTSTGTGTGCSGSTAYARTTTAGQYEPPGVGGACFDSAAAGETLTAASTTITSGDGISGANGAGSCVFRAASGTATHLLEVYDGTNVISSITVTSSTSGFVRATVPNFTFPQSGTVTLRVKSVASNEPVIYIDDCYLGKSENFNQSKVSQAVFVGSITYAYAATCDWNTGNTGGAFTVFAANAGCGTPTVSGSASAPGTKIPGITFSTLPPGDYLVLTTGYFGGFSSTITANFAVEMWDGTNEGDSRLNYQANATYGSWNQNEIMSRFSYSTAQSNITFQPRALSSTNTNNPYIYDDLINPGSAFTIKVYRYPTTQETAQRVDLINWRVDANISGAAVNLGTSNQSSYTGIEDAGLTLTNNTSTTGNVLTAQIPCSSTNSPSGTTCSVGNESVGVSFTLPVAGDVEACVDFSRFLSCTAGGTCSAGDTFEIVETPNNAQTISQEGKGRTEDTGTLAASLSRGTPYHVCGTFSFTSAGQKTLRLFYEQSAGSNISSNLLLADADTSQGQRDVHWVVKPINQMVPTPVFYGGAMGTITNDNASAGYIGEYKSSSSGGTAASFPATTVWGDAGSISLTPGDWDVTACFTLELNSATITNNYCSYGVSTTSGNSVAGLTNGDTTASVNANTLTNSADPGVCLSNIRESLSSTTTIYAKVGCNYTAGTPKYNYRLSARRVR